MVYVSGRHVQLQKSARRRAADDGDRYTRMADAVIAEFAKPTDAMIDAAYEAVRFDEAWAINSRARLGQSRERPGPKRAGPLNLSV
jgi:hypothetical protein